MAFRRAAFAVLAIGALFFCCSCERDPFPPDTWWYVNASQQPQAMNRDGICWIARPEGQDRWCYFPKQVGTFIDHMDVDDAGRTDSATLIINGRTWALNTGDGHSWHVTAPWEDDSFPMPLAVVLTVILIAAGLFVAGKAGFEIGHARITEPERRRIEMAIRDELDAHTERLRRFEDSLNVRQEHHVKRRRQFAAEIDQEETRLETRTKEIEDQLRRGMVGVQEIQAMLRTVQPTDDSQTVGKYLREHHKTGSALGDYINVAYVVDRSGLIRLMWTVHGDRPQPLMVCISRGPNVIRSDVATAGEHSDSLKPGERYAYKFELLDDRDRRVGRPHTVEIPILTAEVWDADDTGGEEENVRKIREKFNAEFSGRQVIQQLVAEKFEWVKNQHYPEDIEAWLLNQLEALGEQMRGGGA